MTQPPPAPNSTRRVSPACARRGSGVPPDAHVGYRVVDFPKARVADARQTTEQPHVEFPGADVPPVIPRRSLRSEHCEQPSRGALDERSAVENASCLTAQFNASEGAA